MLAVGLPEPQPAGLDLVIGGLPVHPPRRLNFLAGLQ